MAASAPAKLPLAIRKDVRDYEEKQNKLLADVASKIGTPPTFNFDLNAAYTNLNGSSYQARIVNISIAYLEVVLQAVERTYKDPLIKQEFDSAWSTHNIALLVVPDLEWEAVKANKTTVGGSYFRLRLDEGELQVMASVEYFYSNLNDISILDLTPLASAAATQSASDTPGAAEVLPLEMRVKMRDVQSKVDSSLANLRQLKGLEDASFNVDQQTRTCYAALKHVTDSISFTPDAFPLYLDELNTLLKKQWKDDMVSEALLEEWTAPHTIELQPETDIEKETGSKVVRDGRYNAVKLAGGKLLLLQGKGHWMTNLSNIVNIDIVRML
ncbi:hypothetical protein MMC34_008747 [Xylographa carneopallida]|nr:hypothetical protein [Xylographa carneopallida]